LSVTARGEGAGDTIERALRRSADLFHEIGSALAVEPLLADARNAILADKLRENCRSSDQLRSISAEGFELCVRALAQLGAADVTIHECGASALGEEPWGSDEVSTCTGSLVHAEYTACPVHGGRGGSDGSRCTGTLVHDEFAACPVHDRRGRDR